MQNIDTHAFFRMAKAISMITCSMALLCFSLRNHAAIAAPKPEVTGYTVLSYVYNDKLTVLGYYPDKPVNHRLLFLQEAKLK